MATSLVVLNAIAVELKKVDGKFAYEFGTIWDVGNEHALNFVIEIEKKFRSKTKTYGFLNIDEGRDSIPTILTAFNANLSGAFKDTTQKMMERLKSSLNEDGRGNTKVGHIVFVHYRNDGEEEDLGRLLVVMVDKKDVFDFGDGLIPTKFRSIDVDTLRQAVMYDLTLFNSVYPEHVKDNQDQAYLKFISGRSRGQFFLAALGTNEMVDNTVSVSNVFDAVSDFARSLKLNGGYISQLRDEVELLIEKRDGKQISLASVAKKIIVNLPETHADKTVDDFLAYVNDNDYKISEVFDVTPAQLRKATNIEGKKGQDYFYRIKKSALGAVDDTAKSVRYDAKKKVLYIDVQDEEQHRELLCSLSDKD